MTTDALNFNQLVALFLAEAIRSKRTSLQRAAEIAQRVIAKLPLIRNEKDTLNTLTDIEKDFEEVGALKQALHFGYRTSDIKIFEPEIKEYASKVFEKDLQKSAAFLQDAASPTATIEQLCLKYPDFCRKLSENPEKASLLAEF